MLVFTITIAINVTSISTINTATTTTITTIIASLLLVVLKLVSHPWAARYPQMNPPVHTSSHNQSTSHLRVCFCYLPSQYTSGSTALMQFLGAEGATSFAKVRTIEFFFRLNLNLVFPSRASTQCVSPRYFLFLQSSYPLTYDPMKVSIFPTLLPLTHPTNHLFIAFSIAPCLFTHTSKCVRAHHKRILIVKHTSIIHIPNHYAVVILR